MNRLVENITIERLREQASKALAAIEADKPTNEQVTIIVDGLKACLDLGTISTKSGLAETRVLDVIADLGTWLTHSNKGGPKARIETAAEALQDTLFLGPWNHAVPEAENTSKRKRKNAKVIEVADFKVTLPHGFEPKGKYKRDVSKALAAIVVRSPDQTVIARFVARTYRTRSATLNYALVSGVWYMAQAGRLDKIDQVNSKDPVFHAQAVAAYDLLDIARQDALNGIDKLIEGDVTNLQGLLNACVKSRWIAEREITRLERMIKAAQVRKGALTTLTNELKFFAARANSLPRVYHPESIACLNVGQIQRIAEAAGLPVEGSSRVEESAIRNKLKTLGLTSDLDRLVPEGIRAAQAGQLDEFWVVMSARAEGDTSWAEALDELFTEVKA